MKTYIDVDWATKLASITMVGRVRKIAFPQLTRARSKKRLAKSLFLDSKFCKSKNLLWVLKYMCFVSPQMF